jgi:hypothetical protein
MVNTKTCAAGLMGKGGGAVLEDRGKSRKLGKLEPAFHRDRDCAAQHNIAWKFRRRRGGTRID